MTEFIQEIEQLRDIWTGRDTYNSDAEWLDHVNAALGELCTASGQITAEFPEQEEN
jgi:hypothetical protein